MKTIHYLADGRVPYELDSEDVELAKLLLADIPELTREKEIAVIKQFHHNTCSLSKAVAIVHCARGR